MSRNKEVMLREIKERCVDKEGLLKDIAYTDLCLSDIYENRLHVNGIENEIFLFECTYIIQKECLALYYP